MESPLMHDRGRGPELIGTRITVYNLLPDFLEPRSTEASICEMYQLTPEQVAAARAYVLNHFDVVWARHLEIEKRNAIGNPPEVRRRMAESHAKLEQFRIWLAARDEAARTLEMVPPSDNGSAKPGTFPSFQEWLGAQEAPLNKVR